MINQTCPLVLHNLYSYDIQSCYPTILQRQFYDFDNIDLDNKEERSIYIGKQQIGNEGLSKFLIKSAESLVSFYLQENNLSDEEIIVTQRDGFIITKLLDVDDQFIDMKLRGLIDFLIISIDREKYLVLEDDKIIIKGMPYFYDGLLAFYDQFKKLNFYNKTILFEQLENIKNSILNCTEVEPFLIPRNENSYIVITYKGSLQVSNPEYVDISMINKPKYFNHYFRDFLRSIYLESY